MATVGVYIDEKPSVEFLMLWCFKVEDLNHNLIDYDTVYATLNQTYKF